MDRAATREKGRPQTGADSGLRPLVTTQSISELSALLESAVTESGIPLIQLVEQTPVLLVFLRHAGCTFCREALGDIAEQRQEIAASGARIVLVHMGDRAEMQAVISKYGLADLERICDSDQRLYQAFGLKQGSSAQLFGLKVWWRGLIAGVIRGHGVGRPVADASQMPGVFLLDRGMLVRRFRHRSAADRPSYVDLCAANSSDTAGEVGHAS